MLIEFKILSLIVFRLTEAPSLSATPITFHIVKLELLAIAFAYFNFYLT